MRSAPLAALVIVGFASPAAAFEISRTSTGAEIRVEAFPVLYDVVDGPPFTLARASRSAFDTWSRASGGTIQPLYVGISTAAVGNDGRSTITAPEVWDERFGEVARTIAHTEVFFDVATGVTWESDVYLNAERFAFEDGAPGTFHTESVVLHELGHLLGLAHTCGDPGRTYPSCFSIPDEPRAQKALLLEAVMSPTLALGVIRDTPNSDDLAALAVHYGGAQRVPTIAGVERQCPSGALVVTGDFEPSDRIAARSDRGGLVELEAVYDEGFVVEDLEGPIDLVVTDPSTGAYGAIVAVELPEPCARTPEPVPAEGCACRTNAARGDGGWLLLGLILFGVSWRSTSARRVAHDRPTCSGRFRSLSR